MNYDGKILAAARAEKDEIRRRNEAEENRRAAEIREGIPRIAGINAQLANQMMVLASLAFSRESDVDERLKALEKENLALQAEKRRLLVSGGYPANYLDDIFDCALCGDTGFIDGRPCACLDLIYNRRLTEELSPLLRSGDECFENFRLDYYSTEREAESNVIPRDVMTQVYNACVRYADNYSPDTSKNMLFTGAPGLGKTYLSACIARKVAQKGYSVCYETAITAFEAFEARKFNNDEAAAEKVNRMLSCDLLILDDLGTEFSTAVNTSFLYSLINDRIIHGKQTIINTNIGKNDFASRYSEQIASRLNGEFTVLSFFGEDIRRKKKN